MDITNRVVATFAAYSTENSRREQSSSGAIFTNLAEAIIARSGVVYGVAMTSDCAIAEFVRVSKIEDLKKLRGSKYVQAVLGKTFISVKADLNAGLYVMFSGTGCQINGLKSFLGKDYPNLICIDVICHGVPSQKLWEKYLNHVCACNGGNAVSINFRSKQYGWSDSGIVRLDSGQYQLYKSKEVDPYMQMFIKNKCLRPSCYKCTAKQNKQSDITLGDFWAADRIIPEFNDGQGISLVIIRTEKGQMLYRSIGTSVVSKEIEYAQGVDGNSAEYESAICPQDRQSFYKDLSRMSFEDLSLKYAGIPKQSKVQKFKKTVKQITMKISRGKKYGKGYPYKILFTLATKKD